MCSHLYVRLFTQIELKRADGKIINFLKIVGYDTIIASSAHSETIYVWKNCIGFVWFTCGHPALYNLDDLPLRSIPVQTTKKWPRYAASGGGRPHSLVQAT